MIVKVLEIIITIIIIAILLYENKGKQIIEKETKKLFVTSNILTIIIFLCLFIYNLLIKETIINSIYKAITISLLFLPISTYITYLSYTKESKKLAYIKTVITKNLKLKEYKKLKELNLHIINISKEQKLNLKIIDSTKFNKRYLQKDIEINSNDFNIIDSKINEPTIMKCSKNYDELYNDILSSRKIYNNYLRNISYNLKIYLTCFLSFIFLLILKFPPIYNLTLILLLKLITTLLGIFIYKKLPYDESILKKYIPIKDKVNNKEEIIINIINAFIMTFTLNIIYSYILSKGGSMKLATTIYLITFTYMNLFILYTDLNERPFLFNFFSKLFSKPYIFLNLLTIIFVLILNYTTIFNTKTIYLKNNLACLICSLIPIIFMELIKLARYLSERGNKHAIKNDK